MEKTMSTTGMTATAAARAQDAVWFGSNTAHAVDLGRFQGRSVSATGLGARDRVAADRAGFGIAVPTTGSVDPCLDGPPV
ncbi:hypothetical protein H9L10_09210 [Phycicoccus endophyticus]|uniref:Uncharacterized protein n=1 Tax=Phycicoccus endophyticus TaxID=1690220 RepID=A0A7G9QYT4_9MICO|nr:hypothetical protein [Phycicoccus endophyticus]NHI20449.1 hypothetical protein [Phycicoccus endophyticus]QNN48509.1 hypothetical protein H9L10_09210 [Phycicoccus endophyticus]GGL30665.1 hypothetical protein GCM10012283_11310 [Phycicoccus endophyticus]